ncbi:Argonaute siRNA chaperone complex subunit Arb1-domain-containing protein [Elsinoe ampelina]|uniref:Argonaute siRNA chaperone complex subunit Arb1-domain-containing protein n=1 Tax=Elsinoe ampelina TaxID=302913 RepID=A0A6A6GM10_9PEZI|nr:Argonaute siRNA chaperone complex subunit Arb1-domain-containing protein [Elsinoe ampelina]
MTSTTAQHDSAPKPPTSDPPEMPPANTQATDGSISPRDSQEDDRTDVEREIIRQVEYYFSDKNLPNDAHMLGLTGGSENWPVNLGRITGFGRMRGYKPKSIVAEALKKSTFIEFTDKKHIRRRVPLSIEPKVEPEKIPGKNAPALQKGPKVKQPKTATNASSAGPFVVNPDQPWLTKGMLKETGFEEYFADAPITPEQYEENLQLYDPDNVFSARIEAAIQRYSGRRKFHTDTRRIFDLWMSYGGIDSGPKQFTGRISKEDVESMDAEEIASALATHRVAGHVEHSDKWEVDFAGVARGFLSTETLLNHTGGHPGNVTNFTNVMTNFYRWIIQNDVCPEYDGQIREAMRICKIANEELQNALSLSSWLPCDYNRACSAISGGTCASLVRDDKEEDIWYVEGQAQGMKRSDAEMFVAAAVIILGDDEHRRLIKRMPEVLETTFREEIPLVVSAINMPDETLQDRFEEEKKLNKHFRALGKMHCRRLDDMMKGLDKKNSTTYTFWVDVLALQYCFVGMKMLVTVCENNIGCTWIDSIRGVNPSYYEVVANGYYEKGQDAVLPKDWYKRQKKIKEYGYATMASLDGPVDAGEETMGGDDGGSYVEEELQTWDESGGDAVTERVEQLSLDKETVEDGRKV